MQTLKKIFFLVPFHLSRHETTVFSVTDATKKVGAIFAILFIFLIKMCKYSFTQESSLDA